MQEAEWLASDDPVRMLRAMEMEWDKGGTYSLISDRKLRLFAAACYREVAEAARPFADADKGADEAEFWAEHGYAAPGVRDSSSPTNIHDRAIDHATGAVSWAHYHRGVRTPEQLNAVQSALLRTIVGNPFRPVTLPAGPPVTCHICNGSGGELVPTFADPSSECPRCGSRLEDDMDRFKSHERWCPKCWTVVKGRHTGYRVDKPCTCCKGKKITAGKCPWLTHADGCVSKLAQVIYDERAWDKMPMLADALEEAGCEDEAILSHCREGGLHVRGDWVIDLLTGR